MLIAAYSRGTQTCSRRKNYLSNIQFKMPGHITRVIKTRFLIICTSFLECLSLIDLLIVDINKFYSHKNHQKKHKHEID